MKPSHSLLPKKLAGLCFLLLFSGSALAEPMKFGRYDVPTLFYIAKSNNRDRVDYAMRLDSSCRPARSDAVVPYWRDMEDTPVSVHSLGTLAYMAYGVSQQRTVRKTATLTDHAVVLKQMDRPIWVTTSKSESGGCSALVRAKIAGVEYAELLSIYVKLAGPISVEYVDVKGRNPATGEPLFERIKH